MKFKSSAIIITFINVIKNPSVFEKERVLERLKKGRPNLLIMIMNIRMPAITIQDARIRNSEVKPSYRKFTLLELQL